MKEASKKLKDEVAALRAEVEALKVCQRTYHCCCHHLHYHYRPWSGPWYTSPSLSAPCTYDSTTSSAGVTSTVTTSLASYDKYTAIN